MTLSVCGESMGGGGGTCGAVSPSFFNTRKCREALSAWNIFLYVYILIQELENLKQATERQEALLNRTENQFTRRLHEFQGDNSNVQ